MDIELEAQGESGPDGAIKIQDVGPGFSAKAFSSKKIIFKVEALPSLDSCLAWGYTPQLGLNGCFPTTTESTPCVAARKGTTAEEGTLWALLHPEKPQDGKADSKDGSANPVAKDSPGTEQQ
ncbi:hypothetical protein [Corallococcus sp. EGB]|uniref:hypothetical protein n=1 Tax=Corallococcus sp. EGB TaxID=1521117 RepID=UPI001CC11806|nr:hypothetical protein [Corallococcus sp. EGB]